MAVVSMFVNAEPITYQIIGEERQRVYKPLQRFLYFVCDSRNIFRLYRTTVVFEVVFHLGELSYVLAKASVLRK